MLVPALFLRSKEGMLAGLFKVYICLYILYAFIYVSPSYVYYEHISSVLILLHKRPQTAIAGSARDLDVC